MLAVVGHTDWNCYYFSHVNYIELFDYFLAVVVNTDLNCYFYCRSFTKSVNTSPTVVYWQEGIFYSYDQGYFCVEAASHYSGTNDHPEEEGVLVKCQSLSGNFTAAGFVMDQIESVLVGWFQGNLDNLVTLYTQGL